MNARDTNTMPTGKPDGIDPLFKLLRIKYAWEGCFEYDKLTQGHAWSFSDSDSWKRVNLEATRGRNPILEEVKKEEKLAEFAKRYRALLGSLSEKAGTLSGQSNVSGSWQLVKWLAGDNGNNAQVGRGLSLILNALVRQSTTKPFDLIPTFVDKHIMVEVRGLETHVPCWFYLRGTLFEDLDEYMVCFPELFLAKANGHWSLRDDVPMTLQSLMHVRLHHQYKVVRLEENDTKIKITLRDKAIISQYPKGAICGCIPIPGKAPKKEKQRKEPDGVNGPETVVTSPVVAEALEQLSRIWQDPYAKSVLISSPPGSGKEDFSNSIPIGNGRPADKVFALSMASDDQKGLERLLYGFAHPDGSIQDGLIAKASDAALFLDEVHQPERDKTSAARASLLRTLEAETYFPQESLNERNVKNVLWIMATSKTIEDLGKFKPIDFWTRMSHALRIEHPLNYDQDEKGIPKRTVIENFFRTFWWALCDKQYQIDPVSDPADLRLDQIPAYWQQRTMLEEIVDNDGKRKSNGSADRFASCFLEGLAIAKMHPAEFSVRGIRSMVARLFAIAWSNVAQGRDPWEGHNFKTVTRGIFLEIRHIARLS